MICINQEDYLKNKILILKFYPLFNIYFKAQEMAF